MERRRLLLIVAGLLCAMPLFAQSETLLSINENRLRLNKTNMYILGGWALGNMVTGVALRSRTEGPTRYFHEMNAGWNLINLGLAAGGLYGSYTADPAVWDLAGTLAEQDKLERIILFNCALNFTYMTAGAWMIERSKTTLSRPERLKGYGRSLVLQGGFLLLFDSWQYLAHHRMANPRIEEILKHVTFTGNGLSIGW